LIILGVFCAGRPKKVDLPKHPNIPMAHEIVASHKKDHCPSPVLS
jgi:hypothetical protein